MLPPLLEAGVTAFKSDREKDVFFISALAVLSGCFSNVLGVYDDKVVAPNLFVFIKAPAGSGKSALSWARVLGLAFHRERVAAWESMYTSYKNRQKEAKANNELFDEPPPAYQCLYIPGNCSSAAFTKVLKENGERGIICETEADTLSGALGQDWGDYSDLMRKGFHHESMSYLRKSGERYEIERPSLSIVLSGTPGQVKKLIPDAENGLFSRFIFYQYETPPIWRDVSPDLSRPSLDSHFHSLSLRVNRLIHQVELLGPILFQLQGHQWRFLNQELGKWLQDLVKLEGREVHSIVFRMGLILYRIAMVLSILRIEEGAHQNSTLVCTDQDFSIAVQLASTLLDHSTVMFNLLPRSRLNEVKSGGKIEGFLAGLPSGEFSRQEADELGNQLKISTRTITNYLGQLTEAGLLKKSAHGRYIK